MEGRTSTLSIIGPDGAPLEARPVSFCEALELSAEGDARRRRAVRFAQGLPESADTLLRHLPQRMEVRFRKVRRPRE